MILKSLSRITLLMSLLPIFSSSLFANPVTVDINFAGTPIKVTIDNSRPFEDLKIMAAVQAAKQKAQTPEKRAQYENVSLADLQARKVTVPFNISYLIAPNLEYKGLSEKSSIKDVLAAFLPTEQNPLRIEKAYYQVIISIPYLGTTIQLPVCSVGSDTVGALKIRLEQAFRYDILPSESYLQTLAKGNQLYICNRQLPLNDSTKIAENGTFAEEDFAYMSLNESLPSNFNVEKEVAKHERTSDTIAKLVRQMNYVEGHKDDLVVLVEELEVFYDLIVQLKLPLDDLPLLDRVYESGTGGRQTFLTQVEHNKEYFETVLKPSILNNLELQTKLRNILFSKKRTGENLLKGLERTGKEFESYVRCYEFFNSLGLLPDTNVPEQQQIRNQMDAIYNTKPNTGAPVKNEIKSDLSYLASVWRQVLEDQGFSTFIAQSDVYKDLVEKEKALKTELEKFDVTQPFDKSAYFKRINGLDDQLKKAQIAYKQSKTSRDTEIRNFWQNNKIGIIGVGSVALVSVAVYAYSIYKHKQKIQAAVKELKALNPVEQKEKFDEVIQKHRLKGYEKDVQAHIGLH